jgi:hypothetical protein
MRFTERRLQRLGGAGALELEVRDVQRAVERARRNQWFGGDVLDPEFAPVLAAIVAPRPLRYATLCSGTTGFSGGSYGGAGANRWREITSRS